MGMASFSSDGVTRIIMCGSRGWTDRKAIQDALFDLTLEFGGDNLVVVHGAAKGADRLIDQEAGKAGLRTEPHPADWERYGKGAGPIRNEEMGALGAERCVAFWDGKSTGTLNMMTVAVGRGIPVHVVPKGSA